ncbi:YceI family protein [Streptomyces sp. HUAS TT3]|uniref:YceI family protein n=1 Tax=Streptomyces sp. HUAS TT3 TaxID=3447510 RepID=UPI003F6606F2
MLTVTGTFPRWRRGRGRCRRHRHFFGDLVTDAASPGTGHAKRDAYLRAADFFDTDRHPQLVIGFVSTR